MKRQDEVKVQALYFMDDGSIPNNSQFPLLIYKNVMEAEEEAMQILYQNHWSNAWRNGVFPYHHYHSNSHEVLVVDRGSALLQMGGENGEQLEAQQGDVLILPAGTGHKLLEKQADFSVIGAYPNGQDYDICYGKKEERPEKLNNINEVLIPDNDPIYGKQGILFSYWR
ncbi:cupin domain-containing protein [Tetragenococcus halophilus]|uniref:cupin domain-containing protein n=1 Tax=Tetragenococcus halophilus TaxID=51669 RepID=UPI001B796CE3|nr:cupin domain-containing protein [Tetragenococcus halophilus]GFK21422.1 hypothetical protein WJ7_08850 [Tetragenococcus halophilus]